MRLVLYSTLETAARSQGDLVNAANPASSEYMQWVNDEWAEIYDFLIMSGEKYFMQTGTGTTISGTADYQLANDFYKIRGVDVQLTTSRWFPAHRFNFERRDDYQILGPSWVWPQSIMYDIWGQPLTVANGTVLPPNLHFLPTPAGGYPFRYFYFQPAQVITATNNQLDLQNGHEKALTFGVAARAALKFKQYEFADRMLSEREKQLTRIRDNLRNMDMGEPQQMRVVRGKQAWRRIGRIGWWGQ